MVASTRIRLAVFLKTLSPFDYISQPGRFSNRLSFLSFFFFRICDLFPCTFQVGGFCLAALGILPEFASPCLGTAY